MQWSDLIHELMQGLKPVQESSALKQRIISLIDLTSLNPTDTESSLVSFFEKAQTPFGHVASICISPPFVRQAVAQFANTPINVATVANFPYGTTSLELVLIELNRALEDGAQEIDV